NHGMGTNVHELVDGGLTADDGPVMNVNVSGKLYIVGNDGVRADLAVVRDMHVGHDPVVVTQAGHPDILDGARVYRHVLTEHIAVADFQSRGFTAVLLVLRHAPYGTKPVEHVVGSDPGVAVDDAMRTNLGARPNGDIGADQAIGADFNVISEHRAWRDYGCGVDACRHISLPIRGWHTSAWLRPPVVHPLLPAPCTCIWHARFCRPCFQDGAGHPALRDAGTAHRPRPPGNTPFWGLPGSPRCRLRKKTALRPERALR